jgi:hypothetical protein
VFALNRLNKLDRRAAICRLRPRQVSWMTKSDAATRRDTVDRWARQLQQGLCALVGVLSLALAGCAAADAPAGPCTVDADCVAGLKCFEGRFCVAATVTDTPVVIRVTPPSDSGFVVEQFKVTLTGASQNETRRLVLTQPAIVRGTVTQKDNLGVPSIPGTLLLSAPGDVEGSQLTFQATSFAALKRFPGADALQGYELRVQKGHAYGLVFWPQSDDIPPHYSSLTAGDSIAQWNLVLPAPSELRTLTGRIVTGANQPMPGLRVWLRDERGQAWSTHGTTDATGRYTFKVDPATPPAHLVFAPDGSGDAMLPSGESALPLTVTAVVDELPTIHLAELPPPVTTRLHVNGPDGQPIAGAQIHLTIQLADLPDDVTLSRLALGWTLVTDADGLATLSAPPLVGDLTVTPPPKSTAARKQIKATVLMAGDLSVTLQSRIRVTGIVRDFASRSLPGAQVTLREVESDGELPDSDGDEATFTTVPDADGNFVVWADAAKYAVWVEPPPGTWLARVMARIDDVTADTATNPWHLVLPPPMVLTGEVLGPDGNALLGVQIDVLAVKVQTPGGRGGPGTPNEGTLGRKPSGTVVLDSHLLGSALSSATGLFEVLLAPGQVAAE